MSSLSRLLRWLKYPVILSYGLAFLLVTVALITTQLTNVRLAPFLCAMLFSAWYGGLRPGMLSLILSVAIYYYLITDTYFPFVLPEHISRLSFSVLTGLLIVVMSAAHRKTVLALRESEQRYLSLFENMEEGVAYLKVLFKNGKPVDAVYLEVNPAWKRLTGLNSGQKMSDMDPDTDEFNSDILDHASKMEVTGQPERREKYSSFLQKWLLVSTYCPNDEHVIVVLADITERRQAEDYLRLVIDTIPTMVWSLLPDGKLEFINERWRSYTGMTLQDAIKQSNETIHPEDYPRLMGRWAQSMATEQIQEDEIRLRRADGEYRWFLVRTVPLFDEHGKLLRWYGASTDIEDRKRAEDALLQTENTRRDLSLQLQALSRRLVELQETERKQLTRVLHDRVGQNLTALKINIDMLSAAPIAQETDDVSTRLSDSASLLESTMDAIEDVASELRPPMLDHHGLVAALTWHAGKFSRRTGIQVTVRGSEPARRPASQVEIALFRIAQEALNNVAKHANAHHVEITLDHEDGICVMTIQDDGIGYDKHRGNAGMPKNGLGMVIMRERAEAVGGGIEVMTLQEGGTRLVAQVPLV